MIAVVTVTGDPSEGFRRGVLESPRVETQKVDLHLSVEERVRLSDAENRRRDAEVRRHVSYWIMSLFGLVNIFSIGFLVWLANVDQTELAAKLIGPGDQIVNGEVLMALLGATTVQLGTIALIMARYVFKAPG